MHGFHMPVKTRPNQDTKKNLKIKYELTSVLLTPVEAHPKGTDSTGTSISSLTKELSRSLAVKS
jgi:hypothetical protein